MQRLIVLAVFGFIVLILAVVSVDATVYYVRSDGSESNDGLSWATAKLTPFSILYKLAVNGDEVWMASGRYGVVGSPLFWKPGVSLYGGFAGNETSREQRDCRANVTYLSIGNISAGYTSSTRIDGFTIYAEVTCDNSSPTFTNNVFSSSKQYSSLGSAILTCKNASPLIANNVFYGRTVGNMSTFKNGAGIVCENGSAPVIRNNILAYGSGISCTSSSPQIINNTIVGNALATLRSDGYTVGNGDGAAIRCFSASPVISNNIIAYNSTGVYTDATSLPVLKNNCIYGNWKYDFKGLANPVGKDGNISSDPVLVSWEYGNLHIQSNSPCKDTGDDGSIEADWLDADLQARVQGNHVDIGADESDGSTWPEVKPRIVYVKPEGADTNDGASWVTAKRTIKSALDLFEHEGGQVWVAAGIYTGCYELPARVSLYGGFAGNETSLDDRDWKANPTALDGQSNGPIVRITFGSYHANTIDGFIFQNAKWDFYIPGFAVQCMDASVVIANNVVREMEYSIGFECWAMYFHNADALISKNTISDIYGHCIGGTRSSLTISGNTITNNHGYSIWCGRTSSSRVEGNCDLVIEDNIFAYNIGSIYTEGGSATVSRNIIMGNQGVLQSTDASSVVVNNNYITGNVGSFGVTKCPSATVINNKFTGNDGGIYYSVSSGLIANNTFAFNKGISKNPIGCIYCGDSSPTIINNIAAYSWKGISKTEASNPEVRNNCVFGNDEGNYTGFPSDLTGTNGNISADPMFTSAETADIHILPGSPCLDAGANDAFGIGDWDIDGEARVWRTVDMGADEYWPLSVQIDIRPGEFPNYINTSGKGLVSVAILTTPTFNALSVDPSSLVFAGASPASRGNGSMVSRKDVDGDGDLDLLAQFCSSDLHLFPSVKSASLVGKIAGDDYVEGFDSVVVAK